MKTSVKLPYMAWYGDAELELAFPDQWQVEVCHMAGKDVPPLTAEGFEEAFERPIDSLRIRDLARGRREVVIAFDDMSRPTRVGPIAAFVLEELDAAGVSDDRIRFIVALGAHGAHSLEDFRNKLGEDILRRFPVFNHNPYECCTSLGETSRGTPVEINAEFMKCDLKIGIGLIVPHVSYGYGGGGKIVLPGLASIKSMWHNHYMVGGRSAPTRAHPLGKLNPTVGLAKYEGNVLRLDMEEATRMAGLDIKIDAVVNAHRETVALFVGDPMTAHEAGVQYAKTHYATPARKDADVVIANVYSKANEGHVAIIPCAELLKPTGGDMVAVLGAPGGQIPHYLLRSGGKFVGGRLWGKKTAFPPGVHRLFLLSEHPDLAGWEWFGPVDQIQWSTSWEQTLEGLQKTHGDGTQVAVVPDGTIQYFV
ncbi:MAG: lactate racemase domain-containing protein [Deltaproteobacteria bacterium]|nr:lactate racemase domain-containing protein [Deltaproteobacteria bacterium]